MKTFDDYMDEIKQVFLCDNKNWDSIRQDLRTKTPYTLVIGAGVTSCVVGSWNQLLNEVAILRILNDNCEEPCFTRDKLLDYIHEIRNGMLLPDATDVLEKGEYLLYDPNDSIDEDEKQREQEDFRETTFAYRVYASISQLKKHRLKGRNYVKDFIDWLDNNKLSVFQIPRKEMSVEEEIKDAIGTKTIQELIDGLNAWNTECDPSKEKLIESNIRDCLSSGDYEKLKYLLPVNNPEKTIREAISGFRGVDQDIVLKTLLLENAAHVLWLPDYGTLDALLELCLKGLFRSILTYNFDTGFESLLSNENVQKRYKGKTTKVIVYSIYDPDPNKPKQLNCIDNPEQTIEVYHVHGILDTFVEDRIEYEGKTQGKDETKLIRPIIFSGTSYESYQLSHFNLGSMAVASAWLHGNLLCVGFSGNDANFRSVLREIMFMTERGMNNKPRHKIYITRSLEEDMKGYGLTKDANIKDLSIASGCLKSYLKMVQNYYERKIGTKIIWDEDFKSMADNLKSLTTT